MFLIEEKEDIGLEIRYLDFRIAGI